MSSYLTLPNTSLSGLGNALLHVKLFDMKVRKSRLLTLAFLPKLGVIYHLLQKPSQAEMK